MTRIQQICSQNSSQKKKLQIKTTPTFKLKISQLFLYFLIFITVLISQNDSQKIRKDIDKRNQELESLRKEITNVEEQIISKTKQAITTTEKLIDIENKISLTEKLIRSLQREERYMNELIFLTKDKISKIENRLQELREQMSQRAEYLYKFGRPSLTETVLTSRNWNEVIYRIKYLKVVVENEKELVSEIEITLSGLNQEKNNYQSALSHKKSLRKEHEMESNKLSQDKIKRRKYLTEIESDRVLLEKELEHKQKMAEEIENIIEKLQRDETEMKRRETELARIRAEQKKATAGNFASIKGRMPWPVQGKIVTHFGKQHNKELNTVTENSGIDIKTTQNAPVSAILDGMVTTVTFLRGYGNLIIIDHGGGYFSVYANVENIRVGENDYVQQYSQLASVSQLDGTTKLHFEIWGNKKKLDPEKWLKK